MIHTDDGAELTFEELDDLGTIVYSAILTLKTDPDEAVRGLTYVLACLNACFNEVSDYEH